MPPLMTIGQLRPLALQPIDQRIVERRDLAVLLRRQALQPGLAGMDHEGRDAGRGAGVDQANRLSSGSCSSTPIRHLTVAGMRTAARDRGHALGHQRRLAHQAGAEAAALHPVGRAADVEVDLVVAEVLADPRGLGQLGGLASRPAAAPPDARPDRTPAAARGRHGSPPRRSASRCRAARARVSARCSRRQCRSVQSIIGATQSLCD